MLELDELLEALELDELLEALELDELPELDELLVLAELDELLELLLLPPPSPWPVNWIGSPEPHEAVSPAKNKRSAYFLMMRDEARSRQASRPLRLALALGHGALEIHQPRRKVVNTPNPHHLP